jgi:hypothetical protein
VRPGAAKAKANGNGNGHTSRLEAAKLLPFDDDDALLTTF